MRVCAIHQPNFFPWLGYFDKIKRADVFVLLDHVHYPKSGNSMGSWCNRVRINIGAHAKWISCPLVREHGIQLIDAVRIDNTKPWKNDIRQALEINYKKAPNFQTAFALIDRLLGFETDSLADFNVSAIRALSHQLDCRADLVRQSELPAMQEVATGRLVAICRAVGADTYLCGGGAGGYQEDGAFAAAGLRLMYQEFAPVPYGEPQAFISGLSIIDWLMHRDTDN